jgi:transposase
MSQLLLPLFPSDSQLITPSLAVYEHEDYVYYLHCGMPIHSHHKDDMQKFRYVTSSLILQGLCKNSDIVEVFHVSNSSVCQWKKKLEEGGEQAFFGIENRHGHSYKLLPAVLSRIQSKLDAVQSVNSIAKEEGLSEGSIRYWIKMGQLKKK